MIIGRHSHLCPRLGVLARGNDGPSLPSGYGFMTGLGVIGAVSAHRVKDFALWNLREQVGQHRCVADGVVRDLDGPDLQGLGI